VTIMFGRFFGLRSSAFFALNLLDLLVMGKSLFCVVD
jgi:hypothetical protein